MSTITQRTSSEELNNILGKSFPLLNKGFIRVVDYMGDDSSVVQAARVSYGVGTKSVSTDKTLIDYLMRHEHNTPFEMAVIKFHVKLPIFVARQWMRHRTGSFNEISARYSEVQDEFYIPETKDIKPQSRTNHQGRDEAAGFEPAEVKYFKEHFTKNVEDSYTRYKSLVEEEGIPGVARELARTVLPVSQYTEFYWTVNLRNLLHFIKLRIDDHAQYEIRVYAMQLLKILESWVPHTAEAFTQFMLNAETFSSKALRVIHRYLKDQILISQAESGMSKREYNDLMKSAIFAGITYPILA